MKNSCLFILSLFFIFISNSSYALTCKNPIRESATGKSQTDAINKALTSALKFAGGQLILTNQHIVGYKDAYHLVEDEIFAYSANYIDSWTLIAVGDRPTYVDVMVCVSSTKIANRILSGKTDSGNLDGSRTSIQLQTIRESNTNANTLMSHVFQKYPRNAFNIEMKNHAIYIDRAGDPVFAMHYKFQWNKDFLDAFQDAVKATSLNRPSGADRYNWATNISFINYPTGGRFVTSENKHYFYADTQMHNHINNLIFSPVIVFDLIDENRTLYRMCKSIPKEIFYTNSKHSLGYDFNYKASFEERYDLKDISNKEFQIALETATKFRISIDKASGCTKRVY